MAKKDKAKTSPEEPIARAKKEYPPDYVPRKPNGKPHPYGGTGEGNPSHRNLKKKCKAKNARDEPCSLPPMRGQEVCGSHGGRTERSKAKAREVLDMLAEPAVYEAGRLMRDAEDEGVRLRAAFGVMDRTGMSPRHALAVTHEVPKYEELMTRIVRAPSEHAHDEYERLQLEHDDDRY